MTCQSKKYIIKGVLGSGDPVVVSGTLPIGGTAGQFLKKISSANYDSAWFNIVTTDITGVTVTSTEINYLGGVTSAIQTQLDGKQSIITGAATTITSSNLTPNRALISNGSGKVAVSAVTSTELGYLSGVTSSVQTQLNLRLVDPTTSVGDIIIRNSGNSIARLPAGTNGQVLTIVSGVPVWGAASTGIANTAANNELPKSDGANIVPSGVFSTSSGSVNLGSASIGGNRSITVVSSSTNASLTLDAQGSGNVLLRNTSGVEGVEFDLNNSTIQLGLTTSSGLERTFSARGSQTHIDIVYNAKGNGTHLFSTGGRSLIVTGAIGTDIALNTSNASSLAIGNATLSLGSTSTIGTTRTIQLQGSESTIDLTISGKGSGNITTATRLITTVENNRAPIRIGNAASDPSNNNLLGEIYYDDTNHRLRYYKNGTWTTIGDATTMSISGTVGTIARFTASNAVGDSIITQSGSSITVANNATMLGVMEARQGIRTDNIGVYLRFKVIPIGDWDMDNALNFEKAVAHGLSTNYKNIRQIDVIIRDDDDNGYYALDRFDWFEPTKIYGGVKSVNSTNVVLSRAAGEFFDHTDFNSTSYNRGWVTIWYEEGGV